jgi:hypothetical protein
MMKQILISDRRSRLLLSEERSRPPALAGRIAPALSGPLDGPYLATCS